MTLLAEIGTVVQELGETDCELLGDGALAQPINALTSLAYTLVGIVIGISAARSQRKHIGPFVYAASLVGIGLGSVAFHGPQFDGSQLLHDLPILVTTIFMLNHDLFVIRPESGREIPAFVGLALLALASALIVPVLVAPLTGLVAVAVVASETVIYRRELRALEPGRQRRLVSAMSALAIAGGAAWGLGRSNSPLCDPDSVLQLHGLWHLLSAGVFALWYRLAFMGRQR